MARLARAAHGYALTIVRGPLVVCSTPHSQSYKAMGKEAFAKSKNDVLDWAERLLGVSGLQLVQVNTVWLQQQFVL